MKIFPICLTFLTLIYKIDCLTNSFTSKCSTNILPCSSDYQCPSNALCLSSQCSCKFGYKLNLQTGCCESLKCFYNFDCGSNAVCRDFWNYKNGHCECETGYSVNRDTQQCALDKQDTKKLNPFVVVLIIVFSLLILVVMAAYKMKKQNEEFANAELDQVSRAHARNNLPSNISETIRENPISYSSMFTDNLNNNSSTRFPTNEREWNIERIRNSQPPHARSNLSNSATTGNNNQNSTTQNSFQSTHAHNNLRNSTIPTSINVANSSFDINEREWTPRNNSIISNNSNNRNSTTHSAHAHNNLRGNRNSTTHTTQRPAYTLPVYVVELNHEKEEEDLPPTYESLFD